MEIGETLIDYELLKEVDRAVLDRVINQGDDSENEDRHISLLDNLMIPLDDKEVFVLVRNLIKYHREDFVKTLEYLNRKEGEKK